MDEKISVPFYRLEGLAIYVREERFSEQDMNRDLFTREDDRSSSESKIEKNIIQKKHKHNCSLKGALEIVGQVNTDLWRGGAR